MRGVGDFVCFPFRPPINGSLDLAFESRRRLTTPSSQRLGSVIAPSVPCLYLARAQAQIACSGGWVV